MTNLEKYQSLSEIAKNTIEQCKKDSLHEYISTITHTTPQGLVWKKIKAFKSAYVPQDFPLVVNNQAILTAEEKAQVMSEHLQMETVSGDSEFDHEIEEACKLEDPILGQPIGNDEFVSVLQTLKNSTPGHDNISNKMLQECHPSYRSELLALLNCSLCSGVVPREWKYGLVVLILKPSKPKEEISSYRPITLLPSMGKLLERILKYRLEYCIEQKKILSPSQFGFRPGKNTEQVVLKLANQISYSVNSSGFCVVVYICLLYTSPSPRDKRQSRMPSSA